MSYSEFTPVIITNNGDRIAGDIWFEDGLDTGNHELYDEKKTISSLNESKRLSYEVTSAKLVNHDAEAKIKAVEETKFESEQKAYVKSDEGKFEVAFAIHESERIAKELAERKKAFRKTYKPAG